MSDNLAGKVSVDGALADKVSVDGALVDKASVDGALADGVELHAANMEGFVNVVFVDVGVKSVVSAQLAHECGSEDDHLQGLAQAPAPKASRCLSLQEQLSTHFQANHFALVHEPDAKGSHYLSLQEQLSTHC